MAQIRHERGFTLLELLIVVSIVAVVVNLLPDFNELLVRERRLQSVLELRRTLNFARSQAINLQTRVTVCALDATLECQHSWQDRDIATFVDANSNHRLDEGEALQLAHWPENRGQVTWRAALGRQQLVFNLGGDTAENGSFLLCQREHGPQTDVVVVVNRGGRNYVREGTDRRCS